ncbi:glycosyltransferase family 4 protein [Hymenobacter weizhouensis]|uniref:glycosyltransferase family 4 protein n=1 Tax=Hymenobacter sp. YIM 151500-1 TaxID=2987689 RepID=UPI0022269C7F|nr:glycosyltransferase family 4 protein [Hymenobacter sp. YIM 151500-1]UYZ61361.1 glycosyltransferase family 4 protein [Hymenobacter sp. YIM 151500-1]
MTKRSQSLRIGFLTSTDPLNRRSWSGVHYSIFRAAERVLGSVEALGPVPMVWPLRIGDNLNRRLIKPLTGKRYHYSWSVVLAKLYARTFKRKLANKAFDLLLAPASFTEIAYLDTTTPVVYIEDSTLNQLIDFYPGLMGLLDVSKKELNFIEKKALIKASLICYSSEWAAHSAVSDYGVDPNKVVVIPFGSNYPHPPTRAEAINHPTRSNGTCHLLFVGGEWGRKGGDIAYDTLVALTEMGVDARLTVVGCKPADAARYTHPGFRLLPFLNMSVPAEAAQLHQLFSEADFFLLPSRAECAAIAFADANSFGVPVITTDVGGISSFIKQGTNGVMLPLTSTGQDFANTIRHLFQHQETYTQMRWNARQQYETTLNWDEWAKQLRDVLVMRNIIPAL